MTAWCNYCESENLIKLADLGCLPEYPDIRAVCVVCGMDDLGDGSWADSLTLKDAIQEEPYNV